MGHAKHALAAAGRAVMAESWNIHPSPKNPNFLSAGPDFGAF